MSNTYPNARDCEHGRKRGKCADCDLRECEADNKYLEDLLFKITNCLENDVLAAQFTGRLNMAKYASPVDAYREAVLKIIKELK